MRRLLRALRHCLVESWEGLWRNPALSVLSVVAIAVSFYVLGLFALVAFNLDGFVQALGRDVQIQIYLREEVDSSEVRALWSAIEEDPAVDTVHFISGEEAQNRFRQTFPALRELSDGMEENPFPASFDLTLREKYRDALSVERVARSYEGLPGVEDVRFDLEWIRRLAGIVALVRRGGLGLGALLGLAMMVTVGAVIRLTVLARREEIEIMKLVGATAAFIRGPFLLAAAVQGAAGGGLAVGALLLTHHLMVRSELAVANPFLMIVVGRFLPGEIGLYLALGGSVLGFLAAFLSLRRTAAF